MHISDKIADAMAQAYWGAQYKHMFRGEKQKLHVREAMKRAANAIPGQLDIDAQIQELIDAYPNEENSTRNDSAIHDS